MVPAIPGRQYNLPITNLHEVSLAIKINANLGQHGGGGGFITWDGRTYRVDVSGTVTRQFSGTLSRVASATWDFFARGSFTSRAQIIGDIIFGRQSAVLPVSIKTCHPDFLIAFAAKLSHKDVNVDMSKVKYRKETDEDGFKTDKFIEPRVPEIATSEGRAKKLSRRIVVRAWLEGVVEDTSISKSALLYPGQGHSAIEVSNTSFSKRSNYISVYPGDNDRLTHNSSYKSDKQYLMGKRTDLELQLGVRSPRPFQHRVKNPDPEVGEFGASASSKIYLPCFGTSYTKDEHGTPVKVLFGLSAQAANSAIDTAKLRAGQLEFELISKDRNCCGTVLKMLLAGGAGKFIRKPKLVAELSYTPLQIQQYTRDLQQYLDWINAYTDKLIKIIRQDAITDVGEFLAHNKKVFSAWTGAPRSIKSCMARLPGDLHGMSKEEQMSQAKILVEFLADEFGENPATAFSEGPLSGASKTKRDGLLSIIRMVNLIRENVCKGPEGPEEASGAGGDVEPLPLASIVPLMHIKSAPGTEKVRTPITGGQIRAILDEFGKLDQVEKDAIFHLLSTEDQMVTEDNLVEFLVNVHIET